MVSENSENTTQDLWLAVQHLGYFAASRDCLFMYISHEIPTLSGLAPVLQQFDRAGCIVEPLFEGGYCTGRFFSRNPWQLYKL